MKIQEYSFVEAMGKEQVPIFGSGDDIVVFLTTYSANGNFKYQSRTNWVLMGKLHDRSITYGEWILESNADFR